MLGRKNVLDLLGNDSRKYHSCVISSYSFDFLFFEQRILPKLRAAGISNINVFVDSGMLEKALANFKGGAYLQNKSNYSLTPVIGKGAFHPKIFLAVGKSKGFLSVGSGNLTGPGLSYNDEIWGSFFYNEKGRKTKLLFQQAKYFVEQLKEHAYDVNLTKLNWLNEANWFKGLNKTSPSGSLKLKDSTISFKTTMGTNSLFNDVLIKFPPEPLYVKIVSPYYNRDGAFLKTLINHFHPQKTHCIINSQNGNAPVAFHDPAVQFSDWNTISKNNQKIGNLHAKAFQFEYKDRSIFILGSANASTEAFGSLEKNGINAEGVLIIDSAKKRDYFRELGIVFPKVGKINLKEIEQINQKEDKYEKALIQIGQAAILPDEIKLFFQNFQTGEYVLKFENADGEFLERTDISIKEQTLIIKGLKIEKLVFKCAIWSKNVRISNYAFLQYPAKLLKTNPDERLARFNALRDKDFFEDLEMELFLDFLNSEDIFYKDAASAKMGVSHGEKKKVTLEPKIVSTEEFNKYDTIYDDHSFSTGPHLSTLIEDFLDALNFNSDFKRDEISDNIEETEIGNEETGKSADDKIEHRNFELSYYEGLRIRNKLEKIFKDISYFIDERCLEEKIEYDIRTLNAMLIALHLIFKYRNKKFERKQCEITLKANDLKILKNLEYSFSLERNPLQNGNINREVSYFIDVNLLDEIKREEEKASDFSIRKMDIGKVIVSEYHYISPTIKPHKELSNSQRFIYFTFANFLNLINHLKKNQSIVVNEWEEKLYRVAILSFQIINHFNWIKEEKKTRDLLLLNLFRDFGLDILENKFIKEIDKGFKKLDKEDKELVEPQTELLNLFKEYVRFNKKVLGDSIKIKQNLTTNLKDRIIFSNKYGFGILNFVYSNGRINIQSPLGSYDAKTNVYGFSDVFIGNKIKVFK